MQITSAVLPDNSDAIATAFQVAMELVNQNINLVSPVMYTLAVYNLGGSNIINFAQDVASPPPYKDNLPYFEYWRFYYKINSLLAGTVSATSDEGTSASLNVPDAMTKLTLADLQYLKDQWGRQYLNIAMRFGTGWGIS
jgi:hypothetical protein